MKDKLNPECSRRGFLKLMGMTGAGLAVTGPANLALAAGDPPLRNDLGVTPDPHVFAGFSGDLLSFAQVTDVHITDTTNPLRAGAIDFAVSAALRPQEHLASRTWDAIVRDVNDAGEEDPLDFLIATGDQIDNALAHEGDWFVKVADGEGMPDTYQDQVGTRPNRQSPLAVPGFSPEGLALPYYVTVGNHDVMIVGNFNAKFVEKALGPLLAVLREKDPAKWDFNITELAEFVGLFLSSPSDPNGHGFAGMPENKDGYYSFTPNPHLHCVVLNTTNDNWLEGISDRYYASRGRSLATLVRNRFSGELTDREIRRRVREHIREVLADFRGFAEEEARRQRLDFSFNDGLVGGISEGTLDLVQREWMEAEFTANRDKLCLVFSHHGPDSFLSPLGNVTPEAFIATLDRHANVIAHIHGHTHNNLIQPGYAVKNLSPGRGYWDITTSSLAEYPMEWRRITIAVAEDGTGRIRCRMARPRYSLFQDKETRKAFWDYEKARYTAALDYQAMAALSTMKGEAKDRDVDLVFALPTEVMQHLP